MASKPLRLLQIILGATLLALASFALLPPEETAGSREGGALRINGAPEPAGEKTVGRTRAEPGRLLAAFAAPRADTGTPAAVAETPKPPTPAPWLRLIGKVADGAGVERLFFKDTRTGRLLKVRIDGTVENGAGLLRTENDRHLLSLDGEAYAAERSGK